MEGVLAPWHLILVAVIVVLLFGAKRLPDSARAIGQSLRIFKAESRAANRAADPPAAIDPPAAPHVPPPSAAAVPPTPERPPVAQLDEPPAR